MTLADLNWQSDLASLEDGTCRPGRVAQDDVPFAGSFAVSLALHVTSETLRDPS